MKSIKQALREMAGVALAAAALWGQAHAAPVVSINPAAQTIGIGDGASIDIIVSGLTQEADAVGGFSLTLGFNSSFLSSVAYTNDPNTRMGLLPLDLSSGFSGGSLDLFFVADISEDQASLAASQGESFILATVSFAGVANGLSALSLSNVVLSNWDGTATLAGVGSRNGQICVADPQVGNCIRTVPEPTTMLLFGTALAALALRRAKQSATV
jgi:hypothetical protein